MPWCVGGTRIHVVYAPCMEEEEEFVTSDNWRGKHNSRRGLGKKGGVEREIDALSSCERSCMRESMRIGCKVRK